MTGKIYFISAEYGEENEVIIENYDNRDGWYTTKYSCEEYINSVKGLTSDKLSCEERCFCKLYRFKIVDAVKAKRYKYAFKLTYFGALRFVKDYTYGL